ncbi:glycosyltransferase family 2 protein [Ideonella sp.]|uniref:glycosyltransferase family 2 protein n=1 Tax=Ideonella sp. TaxID=1929293 RepID=UPI0037BED656
MALLTLVFSNDCTYHSPQLLDATASAGRCTHISARHLTDQFPATFKLEVARRHALTSSADWAFVCDVEEFLVIHNGQGKLPTFCDRLLRIIFGGDSHQLAMFQTLRA